MPKIQGKNQTNCRKMGFAGQGKLLPAAGRAMVRTDEDPFRQPPRGRSAAATSPEGGGKGVVRNGLRLSKSGVQPLRHRLAGDRRRHLPLHRGGFIVSPVSGASAAAWKRGGNRSPGLLRGSGLGDTMRLPGARHQNIKLSGHQDTRDRGGTCHAAGGLLSGAVFSAVGAFWPWTWRRR